MNDREITMVQRAVYEENAIILGPDKRYLIESRMKILARQHGYDSISALLSSKRPRLRQDIAEAMTTNETSFFRDTSPFKALQSHLLPGLIRERRTTRRLRIWSAACSTGQEPYSVALVLSDAFPQLADWDIRITASDYSRAVLEQARAGRYSRVDIKRGLSDTIRKRYFHQDGDGWVISERLRAMIRFQQFNLLGMWPVAEQQDIILLRNVLIYFDGPTRAQILSRMAALLRPDGFLLLGSAESLPSDCRSLTREVCGGIVCYRPSSGGR